MAGHPPADAAATVAVAAFLQACRSENTAAAYRADLSHLAQWCARGEALSLLTVDAADLARYSTACELSGASPATIARRLSAIASFSEFATQQGLAPALATASAIERPAVNTTSTAHLLSDAHAAALLEAADDISPRAGALIRLLMLDGLKVGEAVGADASNLSGRPPHMKLHIARRGPRALLLHPDTTTAIRRYLGARRDGPLLQTERRGQTPTRLTRFGVDYLIKQIAERAGLQQTISGNTLRRRYVVAAHADGIDLDAIRHNAGHSTQRTTRRYLAD